jgi:hypothetical protein
MNKLVHLVEEAEHGSFKYYCREDWVSAAWGAEEITIIRKDFGLGGGIYLDEDESHYTFTDGTTDCPTCIAKALEAHAKQVQVLKDKLTKTK